MNNLDSLREQVLALPVIDRERLLEDIMASLRPAGQEAISKAWEREIESRRMGYSEGRIPTVSVEESRQRLGI